MSLRCKLGRHDWKYKDRIYYSDHGSAFRSIYERNCKRCGKWELGNYGLYGPHPASDYRNRKEGKTGVYPCNDCGYMLRHDFVMPNDLWNEVTEDPGIILCYDCFCDRAEKKGYIPVFKCELAHSSTPKVKT